MKGQRIFGARNGRWNAGKLRSSHGYVLVRVGIGHPLADSKGLAYEHRVVWAASGRRMPGADETIHHVNGDKTDNRLTNLEIVTRREHSRLHAQARRRADDGTFARELAA